MRSRIPATYSIKNFCLDRTLVLLHVLKASAEDATAASNSSGVVSGTLVRRVWVDCDMCLCQLEECGVSQHESDLPDRGCQSILTPWKL